MSNISREDFYLVGKYMYMYMYIGCITCTCNLSMAERIMRVEFVCLQTAYNLLRKYMYMYLYTCAQV